MTTTTGSRRRAILEAMVHAAGDKGYVATSVGDVVALAGASRATFYKHFEDKQDCFLAAYEMAVERVFDAVVAGCDAARPWTERIRTGLATIVELFGREPELARVAVVEGAAVGGVARRRQLAALARFGQLLEAGCELSPGAGLPASAGLMAASAVTGLIFDELQQGRASELPGLLPELTFAALIPYVGPRVAAEEMRQAALSL